MQHLPYLHESLLIAHIEEDTVIAHSDAKSAKNRDFRDTSVWIIAKFVDAIANSDPHTPWQVTHLFLGPPR